MVWTGAVTEYGFVAIMVLCLVVVLLLIIVVERTHFRPPGLQVTDKSKPSLKKTGVANKPFQGYLEFNKPQKQSISGRSLHGP
jgi:hypothetical protein